MAYGRRLWSSSTSCLEPLGTFACRSVNLETEKKIKNSLSWKAFCQHLFRIWGWIQSSWQVKEGLRASRLSWEWLPGKSLRTRDATHRRKHMADPFILWQRLPPGWLYFCKTPRALSMSSAGLASTIDKEKKKNKNPNLSPVCASLSVCVWLFVTLWTVAWQASLCIEFSRQEY